MDQGLQGQKKNEGVHEMLASVIPLEIQNVEYIYIRCWKCALKGKLIQIWRILSYSAGFRQTKEKCNIQIISTLHIHIAWVYQRLQCQKNDEGVHENLPMVAQGSHVQVKNFLNSPQKDSKLHMYGTKV